MTEVVSSSASATSLTSGYPGLVEGPDEPGEPDQGHQPAGPVGRLVVPDRQSAVQIGQADREMQQTLACGLAGAHRDRLACHGPQRPEDADRKPA